MNCQNHTNEEEFNHGHKCPICLAKELAKTKANLAVPPYQVNGAELVIDATGSTVLACSEETDCPLRFSEREVSKDGHFICPNCGRLGQRMIEASPKQCGIR